MRPFALAAVLMTALTAPAVAVVHCPSAADQSAYEVLALRTQMIVLATKNCGREQEYNRNFAIRFQPALQANERAVSSYFRRAHGGAGQSRKDTFSTELVNVMSQEANRQGPEYCSRAGLIISEINALRSMDELAAYAAVKAVTPEGTSMCAYSGGRRR